MTTHPYLGGGITVRENIVDALQNFVENYISGNDFAIQSLEFCSIANLVGLSGTIDGQTLICGSYYDSLGYLPGNSGAGVLIWDSAEPKANHNGVTIFSPTVLWDGTQATLSAYHSGTGETDPSGTGCWIRQYDRLTVEMAGAVGDRVTDDSVAFNQISNVVGDLGGGAVDFTGSYLIDQTVTVREYVHFRGNMGVTDQLRYQSIREYDAKNSTLIVNSAATITPLDGGSVGGCIVIRKGLSLPFADATAAAAGIAAFAGNAFTVGGPGNYFYNMLVLGFDKSIYGIGYPRVRCTYIIGDCTNGIDIQGALDVCHLDKCHFWPFTTTHQTGFPAALTVRSGFGFRYKDTADWCKMEFCFSYGYDAGGTIIDSCNSVELWGGGADFFNGLVPTQPGLQVIGNTEDLFTDSFRSTYAVGVLVNSTTSRNAATLGVTCHANTTVGVRVLDGYTIISNSVLRNNPTGVDIDPNSDGAQVHGNRFDASTEPIKASGDGLRKSKLGVNTFNNCVDTLGIRDYSNNGHPVIYNESFSAGVNGRSQKARIARGSVATPAISQSGDIPWKHTSEVYDGSNWGSIGSWRFESTGVALNDTSGKWVLSTTPAGSTTPVQRIAANQHGSIGIGPSADSSSAALYVSSPVVNGTTAYGIRSLTTIPSAVTASYISNDSVIATEASAFTLTNYFGYRSVWSATGAGSAITNVYGFYADPSIAVGTTINRGFNSALASGANNWNFYASGTARNFMAGRLDVAGTARTGSVAPSLTNPTNFYSANATFTDGNTSASGTVAHVAVNSFDNPALAATNASVTYTNASTVYIDGAPTASANITITSPYSLYVASGSSYFGGEVNTTDVFKVDGTQVVSNRATGWTADSGTAKRTANTTYSGTAEGAYTQATIQALMDAVRDQSQTIKALKDDLISHGLIGS
jgi:hypothetical protein